MFVEYHSKKASFLLLHDASFKNLRVPHTQHISPIKRNPCAIQDRDAMDAPVIRTPTSPILFMMSFFIYTEDITPFCICQIIL